MGAVVGLIAFLVALVGLLVTLGYGGYLAMLSSAASKRGLTGESTLDYVRGQRTKAGLLAAVALIGLLFTSGGVVLDLLGLVLGAGAGLAGYRALEGTRHRFRGDV
ncbi:MAG TPA: hypothetical protein VGD73_14370 [Pseudonocardia sp.]|jgi:hypothetical protein|uniref:hypothetical protein n=1 Tax=Pseudonocardia sp. TaxID=60912 RepID=UPI002ED9C902